MDDLHQVEEWLAALLERLSPAERKKMMREVAKRVRQQQQQNMAAQRDPDGKPWAPRKVNARFKQGRVKRKMFTKLRTGRFLKTTATANEAAVFFAPGVQRIAQVHHYGLRDFYKSTKIVKYKSRYLIGANDSTVNLLHCSVLNNIIVD